MFRALLSTGNQFGLTLLRLALGVVFFAHGSQKVLGWFGGGGFQATLNGMTEHLHIPAPLVILAMMAEFLGGLGLIVGLLSRVAAFGIVVTMVVAVALVHGPSGLFFMNWEGNQKGEGYEYHILAIAMGLAVLFHGGGALSWDYFLSRRRIR